VAVRRDNENPAGCCKRGRTAARAGRRRGVPVRFLPGPAAPV